MAGLIDEFLYGLGFSADLRGGQAFDEQLSRIGDHGESTRHSLLSTITAANLLSHTLEKGAELIKDMGSDLYTPRPRVKWKTQKSRLNRCTPRRRRGRRNLNGCGRLPKATL